MTQSRWITLGPPLAALGLAAAWPLTAYAVSPFLLPALFVVAGIAALVMWRLEYGIALALGLAPWTNMRFQGGAGEALHLPGKPFHLVLPALAIGLVAYSVLPSRTERASSRSTLLTTAVLLFVAAALASSMQALKPSATVTKVVLLLTAAALFFVVTQVCRERQQLLVVAAGAVLGLLTAAAQGVIQHFTGQLSPYGFIAGSTVIGRIQGSFGHPNQYGGFIAVLIPLAFVMLVNKRFPPIMRWLGGVSLGFAIPALIFSYARGAIGAVVIGSVLWMALFRPRAAVLATVGLAMAAIIFAPSALKQRFNPQGATGDVPLRADIWQAAIDIYSNHPVLGVGVNNFSTAYADLPSTQTSASQRRLLHQSELITPPHAQNEYLNIMAEEGLVGLLAFVLLASSAVAIVYRGCRIRDPLGRSICLATGAGLLTFGLHSLFEAALLGEVAIPLFALMAVAAGFVALDRGPGAARAGVR